MEKKKVVIFCGGRGNSTIIKEFVKRPHVEVTLLVNAYDDGLSTGELRKLVPGMLGPSDIRKNVSNVIELYSDYQYALLDFFKYRFPLNFSKNKIKYVIQFFNQTLKRKDYKFIPKSLLEISSKLNKDTKKKLFHYISVLFNYLDEKDAEYDLSDYSVSNLLYAGVFISSGMNNNKTINIFSKLFVLNPNVKVYNVTKGENLILVGLKKSGQFLEQEADIVSKQSKSPITNLFLIKNKLSQKQINYINKLKNLDSKIKYLNKFHTIPVISDEAKKSLLEADIIIYGTGTQHSSLLPSYMTRGVTKAIKENKIAKKISILNICEDHDIQNINAHDIFDNILRYMNSTNKNSEILTHTIYTKTQSDKHIKPRRGKITKFYNGAIWINSEFERRHEPGIHMGSKTVDTILKIYQNKEVYTKPSVDIMINMHRRKKAIPDMINELRDLNWYNDFSSINLHLQSTATSNFKLPNEVNTIYYKDQHIEEDAFKSWFKNDKSQTFVSLTGDGVYRIRDVINNIRFLENSEFGAVLGSRNQDKKQMLTSVSYAYDKSSLWYVLSLIASYVNIAIYAIKYQKVLSDPLTGFRIYKKESISNANHLLNKKKINQISITSWLLKHGINIAEVPIYYRTFKGFTDKKYRVSQAIKNTLSIIRGK